ncbi:hypothetical protein AB0C52_30480 [Streptomyces sp. NPDC048717]|uniref:hypothetical protein n=1 Tax=Streptomyces sp. NPDC048717 TaxID=3154928 RepID=UPI003419D352
MTYEDGEKDRVYRAPDADAYRAVQLIIGFAQEYGGRLGPVLFPIEKLDNEQAVEQIRANQERSRSVRRELFGDDV